MEVDATNEDYVIQRAKSALETNPLAAKAWMITAKTLYPNNFGVQFEAYCIEKQAGHVKEAAKCFSELITKFQQQPDLWKEIEKVTQALKTENDSSDPERQFLCEMFKHISMDVQHKLLLFTADHCDDTMEHCRLLLLLLQRFPMAISSHGPRLVDTLLSAEKHSHASNQPVNAFRKLLVCDLLPLLSSENVTVDLSQKLLYKLLHKAIEFYLCSLGMTATNVSESDCRVEEPWKKLYGILELVGRHLGWDKYLLNFGKNWSKESYWQKILSFCRSPANLEDHNTIKQISYCATIFFLNCLHDYKISLIPENGQNHTSYILVEAFIDKNFPNPVSDTKSSKRRKGDSDASAPYITIEKDDCKNIKNNFTIAVSCWDLLNSTESLQREFMKLNGFLKLENLLTGFLIDCSLYKGRYDDAVLRIQQDKDSFTTWEKNIKMAGILFSKKSYTSCFEHILQIVAHLPVNNPGNLSKNLVVGGNQRHLHYLPATKVAVLQYCVKLLLRCIKDNMVKHPGTYNELAIGNTLALVQLDWPQEEDTVPPLMEQIQQRKAFHYHWFQNYIINVDILEEITYLWTSQGGQITLDIIPHLGQRRIGTRGSDKGVKEEIKQAIRRQISRSNEPLDELTIKFLTQERGHILQTLM